MNKESTSIIAIVLISFSSILFYLLFIESRDLFCIIDNSKVSLEKDSYIYEVEAYDARGQSRTLMLKTKRLLPNELIIKMKASWFRGINSWQKIKYGDLPYELYDIFKDYLVFFSLQNGHIMIKYPCFKKEVKNMDAYEIRLGKFLSLILRHKPETIGISMDEEGWVNAEELITKMNSKNPINMELLKRIVANDSKGRFAFNEDGTRIRAVNGHSLNVDVKPELVTPPGTLYHGTSMRFLQSIAKNGLTPQSRRYVHLSPDEKTAYEVGERHGQPIVLEVDTEAMQEDGLKIYRAENGVYLTDLVPTEYLRVLDLKALKNCGKNL